MCNNVKKTYHDCGGEEMWQKKKTEGRVQTSTSPFLAIDEVTLTFRLGT